MFKELGAAFSALGIAEDAELSDYNGMLDSEVHQLVKKLGRSFRFDDVNDAAKLLTVHGYHFILLDTDSLGTAKSKALESIRDYVDRNMRPRSNVNLRNILLTIFSYFYIPGDLGLLTKPEVDTDLTMMACKDFLQIYH